MKLERIGIGGLFLTCVLITIYLFFNIAIEIIEEESFDVNTLISSTLAAVTYGKFGR